MRRSKRPIVIASRLSRLARAQAQTIGQTLAKVTPNVSVDYRWIESEADRFTDRSLADAGGKGLFTGAVELAVLNGDADMAVHSLKDMPANEATPGLIIAAVPQRADPRDCLIAKLEASAIDDLPRDAVLGTASPRRAAQVKRLRQDIEIRLIRGNVETRIRKVIDQGDYDATLLAVAGLQRLELTQHTTCPIDPSVMLPAAGQGALAIQCRTDDHVTLSRCLPLNDALTAAAVHAERQIVAGLNGDCHSPIAVLIEPSVDNGKVTFRIRARVLSPDGQRCLETDEQTDSKGLDRTTKQICDNLRRSGSDQIMAGG